MKTEEILAVLEKAKKSLTECNVPPECFSFGPGFAMAQERHQAALHDLAVTLRKLKKEKRG